MRVFIDADACPVVSIVENISKKYNIPVTLLCDTNHVLTSEYSEVIVVGAGADAVDYKLITGEILWFHRIMEWQRWRWERVHLLFISLANGTPMTILIRCLWSDI